MMTTNTEEVKPNWDEIPSNEELLAARETITNLFYAIGAADRYGTLWGGLVEAKRILTVTMDWLAYYKPEYRILWEQMLEQE